jgi:hypothetical protein
MPLWVENAKMTTSLEDLINFLEPKSATRSVKLLLAFDEAHVLHQREKEEGEQKWTSFSELRRALRQVRDLDMFSVFLSTVGKVELLAPPVALDNSGRVQKSELKVHRPFTALGLDQLAVRVQEGQIMLDDVVERAFMVNLGRPL